MSNRWDDAADMPEDDQEAQAAARQSLQSDDEPEVHAHSTYDPSADDEVIEGQVAETAPKKRNGNKMVLLVGGLVMLAFIVFIGSKFISALRPKPPAASADLMAQAEPVADQSLLSAAPAASSAAADAGLLDAAAPASEAASQPVMSAQAGAQAGGQSGQVAAYVAPAQAGVATAATPPQLSSADAQSINRRLDSLEQSIAQVSAQLTSQAGQSHQARQERARTRQAVSAVSGQTPRRKVEAPKTKSDAGADAPKTAGAVTVAAAAASAAGQKSAAEGDAPGAAAGLSDYKLRAVYPASGPNMQAWVVQGEMVRVVAKGSVINGARVLSVSAEKVVTDQGVIY